MGCRNAASYIVVKCAPVYLLIELLKISCSFRGEENVILINPVVSKTEGQIEVMMAI